MEQPRICVIDGANIGHYDTTPGEANGKKFSTTRLLQAVSACHDWGMRPIIILPQKFLSSNHQHNVAEDVESLLALQTQHPPQLIQTPSYCNDDIPCLRMAIKEGGYVLSNDGFQDHIKSGFIDKTFAEERLFKCSLSANRDRLALIPPKGCYLQGPSNNAPAPPVIQTTRSRSRHSSKSTKSTKSKSKSSNSKSSKSKSSNNNNNNNNTTFSSSSSSTNDDWYRQRIQFLESENEELRHSNTMYGIFEQLACAETNANFHVAFEAVESMIQLNLFQEEDYKKLVSIVKLIHLGEKRQESWICVKARYGIIMLEKKRKEEEERALREYEERQRLEAEKQRMEAERARLDREYQTQQLKLKMEEERKQLLLQQHQSHFNIPNYAGGSGGSGGNSGNGGSGYGGSGGYNGGWQGQQQSAPAAPMRFLQRAPAPSIIPSVRQQQQQQQQQQRQQRQPSQEELDVQRAMEASRNDEQRRRQLQVETQHAINLAEQRAIEDSRLSAGGNLAPWEEQLERALKESAKEKAAVEKEQREMEAALEASRKATPMHYMETDD